MTTTAQQLLDRALMRHYSFKGAGANEGAMLAYLDQRQRKFLLDLSRILEALVGTTAEIQTALSGAVLVAIDGSGNPYFTDTVSEGFAIRMDGGIPYVDLENPLIIDPFGSDGSSPGLPLPDNLLRLISVVAFTPTNTVVPLPVEVLNQEIVTRNAPRTGLQAFLSANRLVPVHTSTSDLWNQVTSVRLSTIICPSLTSLTDDLTIPDALLTALESDVCAFLAYQTKDCPAADRAAYRAEASKEYVDMLSTANAMDAVTTSSVQYRRR